MALLSSGEALVRLLQGTPSEDGRVSNETNHSRMSRQ